MDAVTKTVQYICENAMNHHQFIELLKQTADNEFNDCMFFASLLLES